MNPDIYFLLLYLEIAWEFRSSQAPLPLPPLHKGPDEPNAGTLAAPHLWPMPCLLASLSGASGAHVLADMPAQKSKGVSTPRDELLTNGKQASGKILPAFCPRGLVLRGSLYNLL